MDAATSVSNASTLIPADSVSQAGASGTPPKSSKAKPKRPSKAMVDKNAPPGAVQVTPGKVSSAPASKVTSSTIPLSGWGELDLTPRRRDIEPTFTTDARPFADMVDTTYQSIQARFSSGGKHIPRSLYRYYCFVMWWYRAIWLHKSNGKVLNTDQKNFLSILSQMEELQVPAHVAQYLGNMGNFLQGGEQYYYNLRNHNFATFGDSVLNKGWLEVSAGVSNVSDAEFWTYAQVPVPAVLTTAICNEASLTVSGPADNNLDLAAPLVGAGLTVYPSGNIIGWDRTPLSSFHSSWRGTFSSLGWGLQSLPPDIQTQFCVSTSTLKWVSERLSTLRDFKVNSIKQLSLSTQGHPMQAYFLGTDVPQTQSRQFPLRSPDLAVSDVCASRHSELSVKSRYAIDSKILAPAFAFGYRLERSLAFRDWRHGEPRHFEISNYQPWYIGRQDGGYQALNPAQLAAMNGTFDFGSQPFMNVARFSTHELNRSTGLDAALVLSDIR